MTSSPGSRLPRRWLLLVLAILLAQFAFGPLFRDLVAAGIRSVAAARGFTASWASLDVSPPLRARFRELTLSRRADGDTLVRAESLAVSLDPWALLILRPRLTSLVLAHASVRLPTSHRADPDTLPPEAAAPRDRRNDPRRGARVRALARSLVRLLVAPARELPRLSLRDVVVATGPGGGGARRADDPAPGGARIAWLDMATRDRGLHLAAAGQLLGSSPVPFEAALDYGRDDRISGGARFDVPVPDRQPPDRLRIAVDGALHQDPRAGRVTIDDSTQVSIGTLRFRLGGEAALAGPSFRLALAAERLTAAQWKESLPRTTLGPLVDLAVRGWYAYHVSIDVDLSRPDSVEFTARVQPHGLQLDSTTTRLDLLSLDQPFIAHIHLPRDRVVDRDLSPANPHFRPLAAMDSLLVYAVVTNEDGAFFRHGGFNTEAVKSSIADNLKAGAYRRGAGTITMQLVRNLYLGHARTLARKGQEVVLAWVLEHLTPLTKERMLEIYLNIIEWGPDIHGADEAAHYYFGHDAGHLTVDEALFLATVVPSPVKWRNRFDQTGALRPFERAQMHFIGRAMIHKERLLPELLPMPDSLRVELRGPARDLLVPPAPTQVYADSTAI